MPTETEKRPIIEIRQMIKSFGSHRVLEDINLDVYTGEIMVIIGGSGCGKSTLLRHLIGSLSPDQGSVKLFGQEITTMSEIELNEVRKNFGILFQSGALFNSLTVGENVALLLQEHSDLDEPTIEIMVKIKLELVDLREHSDKMPAQLSGGMKKRAALARAIALDPQILFYDEPSAGLDPVTSAQIDQLIVDLTRKLHVTSIVVTHEMDSAFAIADRMCMLDRGRILKTGSRQEFEALRDSDPDQLQSEQDKLIRQFLRGDAHGPITDRKITSDYEDDILTVSLKYETQ
ncbi:MAG: ABC transporter ATP-binding protein [Planctomycetota bacterium]|jgi:phospholipid/cholesterol/gamma-HCH transport system ATP-binding protein